MANNVFRSILVGIERKVKGYSVRKIANSAADRIRKRTRLGYGVEGGERGGAKVKLKPLTSEEYKKYRKRARQLNRSITKPNRSNLTFTGKLLDALRGTIVNGKAAVKIIENRKDGALNRDIVKGQAEMGRHFFELTDKELKGLRSEVKKDLIKAIRNKK